MNPIDFDLKKEIASIPGGENVMHCFLCGTCTAGCPVSGIDDAFSPFLIMHDVLLGGAENCCKAGLCGSACSVMFAWRIVRRMPAPAT